MMDLLELTEKDLKKLKVSELKKLIKEQELFEIKKSYKKKDLLKKIKEVKKEYEDSDSEESEVLPKYEEVPKVEKPKVKEPKVEEITEIIQDFKLEVKSNNKFEKKDKTKNYIIFNSNILYDVSQNLKELVDHCLIVFNENGFKINTVDKCLVSLVNINIKECYHSYNFLNNEVKIVVNLVELLKILDCKESDQKIKFIFTDDFLEIYYYTENEKYDKFKLHLLDENLVDELNDFDIEFPNSIELVSRDFNKMCGKIKKFDDKMNIVIENGNLRLSSKNKTIELNDKIENTNDLDIILLLKYVLIFCKTEKISKDLEFCYSDNNSPVKFLYRNGLSSIEYIITPQNEDD